MSKQFYKILLDIGVHASMADDLFREEEKELIRLTAKVYGIEYIIPENLKEELPPLEELVSNIDTARQKKDLLDFIIHLLAVEGDFAEGEQRFLKNLCRLLNIENKTTQVESVVNGFTKVQKEWLILKDQLF